VSAPEEVVAFTVASAEDGKRLDLVLVVHVPDRSRAQLQKHIERGAVTIDDRPPKRGASTQVRAGDVIKYAPPPPESTDLVAEDIPLSVLYEDEHVLVLDKPKGLVVHPALGHARGTLVNAVLHYLGRDPTKSTGLRPGIVHRLDRDTTGVIAVAKNERAQDLLSRAFQKRRVEKHYVAVCVGVPKKMEATIDTWYGRHPRERKRFSSKVSEGKRAVTHYRVRESYPGAALLDVRLETGRTHQIRVHLADLGHPLVGDTTYGRKSDVRDPKNGERYAELDRPALHAARLVFPHPITEQEIDVIAPLPSDLIALIEALRARAKLRTGGGA
jgi:23S rRNA pseudouridine1911/1915/1917 synthase